MDPIQLLKKIVKKNKGAFAQFYDHFAPLVFSLSLKILRSKVDAEEVVQDVFYQIWRDAKNYSAKRGKPEAWIITITRSRSIDRLRSRKRKTKNTVSLDQSEEETGFLPETTSAGSEQSDARITLQGLLGTISRDQRQTLELAYFKGMTQSEIAAHLKIPLGTVKTRMRDGLNQLRCLMKEKEAGQVL